MSNKGYVEGMMRRMNAHKDLSVLIQDHLGVAIDPFALRLFVNAHWSKVSLLAHLMHEGEAPITEKPPESEFLVPPK